MPRATVVAIPLRDEAKRIGGCLAALSRQSVPADHVVLLLNNCRDGTAEVVKATPKASHRLHIVECELEGSSASAGVARGLAMNYSASLIDDGVVLTTDADAEVPENWIEANLRAIEEGSDAVCGMAVIDPLEALLIPRHLHQDDAHEMAYGRLLDEIGSIILPDPADPWPRHSEDSGASIAMTASMFRQIGGLPCIPSGEDRALIGMLRLIDARVRHDPNISVVVSGRTEGRAQGGMADTIRRRMVEQDEFVDDRIEPAWVAFRRLRMKRHFSLLWHEPTESRIRKFAKLLAVAPTVIADAIAAPYVGAGWSQIEEVSSLLARRRVRFVDLPWEMAIARRIRRFLSNQARFGDSYAAELAAV
jgi:glycosyltransferase involved in cell wall biosynthesis